MSLLLDLLVAFLGALIASMGFAIFFENHGKFVYLSAIGGAIAWTLYVYFLPWGMGLAAFSSGLFAAAYAETLARVYKAPATVFLIIEILPMVPGADIFNAMKAVVLADWPLLTHSLGNTLTISGYIALGILLVSSTFILLKHLLKLNFTLQK